MNKIFRWVKNDTHILYLVLFFELINLSWIILFFLERNYLPAPFVADKNDTFMDFYNPLFWVINDGFYTIFHSIYPAINYLILKAFSFGIRGNEITTPFILRDANILLTFLVIIIYLLIILTMVSIGEWKKIKFSNRFLIFISVCLSVPFFLQLSVET